MCVLWPVPKSAFDCDFISTYVFLSLGRWEQIWQFDQLLHKRQQPVMADKINLMNRNLTFDGKTPAPFIQLLTLAIKKKLEISSHLYITEAHSGKKKAIVIRRRTGCVHFQSMGKLYHKCGLMLWLSCKLCTNCGFSNVLLEKLQPFSQTTSYLTVYIMIIWPSLKWSLPEWCSYFYNIFNYGVRFTLGHF